MSVDLDPRWNGAVIPRDHWHFHSQLLARYGVVLGPGDFGRLLQDLEQGCALLMEQRGDGSAIYSVRIRSAWERIYVLVERGHVVTAWPPERRLNELRRTLTAAPQGPCLTRRREGRSD